MASEYNAWQMGEAGFGSFSLLVLQQDFAVYSKYNTALLPKSHTHYILLPHMMAHPVALELSV